MGNKFEWKKGDLIVEKKMWKGKEVEFFPFEKRPLSVSPKSPRRMKEYSNLREFEEDYPTKESREQYAGELMNYEIDELIGLCKSIDDKEYYDNLKKKEMVFDFRSFPCMRCVGEAETYLSVYDGPGTEKCVEYGNTLKKPHRIGLGRKELTKIQEAIEDNVLFETEEMEDPFEIMILDGMAYEFFFAVKGRENRMHGYNIEECRWDYDHCMHSAHAIRALEEIREILVPLGVPKKYFEL